MGDPAERMKMRRPHIVPLSAQVVDLFKQLKPITYHYPYIFIGRNNRSKPISKESVSQVIELLGYKGRATGHGLDIQCRLFYMSKDTIVNGLNYSLHM